MEHDLVIEGPLIKERKKREGKAKRGKGKVPELPRRIIIIIIFLKIIHENCRKADTHGYFLLASGYMLKLCIHY